MKNKPIINIICGLMGLFGIAVAITAHEIEIGQFIVHFCAGALIVCCAGLLHKILSK